MEQKYTRNLSVEEGGATLYAISPETSEYRCMGVAYGWNEEPVYDADRKLINALTSNDEARANAKLWAAAPELLEALQMAAQSAGFQYMTHETREVIEAAIAKATVTEEVAA